MRRFPGTLRAWKEASVIVAALVLAPALALAQISPGELSRAHAALDGPLNCRTCHSGKAEEMPGNCLSCHGAVADARAAGRGLHARVQETPCARCHPEHAGRDFALIEWEGGSPERFDHTEAGWPLLGRHAALRCRECHREEFQSPNLAKRSPRSRPEESWLGLDPNCASCHRDIHEGRLGADCAACHGTDGFVPAEGFDHARTAFPLTGRHMETACEKCHEPVAGPEPGSAPVLGRAAFSPLAHGQCGDCHADPHAERFGPDCAKCHVTSDFRAVADAAFDHGLTRFALKGRHATLPCASCHDPDRAWGKRPSFASCADCHIDPHGGEAAPTATNGDCAGCHDERSFRPSTYTAALHAATSFPLLGRHAEAACASCHRNQGEAPVGGLPRIPLHPAHASCRDCHGDAHAGQLAVRPDGGACESCHGVDGWKPARFGAAEHATLRMPLTARHAEIACAACHGPERADLPRLPDAATLGPAGVWFAVSQGECRDCHQDPHGETFPTPRPGIVPMACADCHGGFTFAPSILGPAGHERLGYPLAGAHAAVPCVECHRVLDRVPGAATLLLARPPVPPLRFAETPTACVDCHEDPHAGQFSHRENDGCDRCHGVDAFTPADRFDHERDTRFSLRGAHATVSCAGCHPRDLRGEEGPVVRYTGTPVECERCHGRGIPPSERGGA